MCFQVGDFHRIGQSANHLIPAVGYFGNLRISPIRPSCPIKRRQKIYLVERLW